MDTFESHWLEERPETTLAKNRLSCAIEDIITWCGQRQHVTQEIGLDLCAVNPEWTRGNDKNHAKARKVSRPRHAAHSADPARLLDFTNGNDRCAPKDKGQRMVW